MVRLDPCSLMGYARKREILHIAGYYEDAIATVETMLSKISQSSDPNIRGEDTHVIWITLLIFCCRAIS